MHTKRNEKKKGSCFFRRREPLDSDQSSTPSVQTPNQPKPATNSNKSLLPIS